MLYGFAVFLVLQVLHVLHPVNTGLGGVLHVLQQVLQNVTGVTSAQKTGNQQEKQGFTLVSVHVHHWWNTSILNWRMDNGKGFQRNCQRNGTRYVHSLWLGFINGETPVRPSLVVGHVLNLRMCNFGTDSFLNWWGVPQMVAYPVMGFSTGQQAPQPPRWATF